MFANKYRHDQMAGHSLALIPPNNRHLLAVYRTSIFLGYDVITQYFN